jgi:transposase
MRDFLYDEFDINTSVWTVYCELERIRWSRKVALKRAKERSEPVYHVYLAHMAQRYTAEQIVAVDESACNERTGDRKYGWSPGNTLVELSYSFKRSERWSLLPVMTINSYMSYIIFQGSISAALMEEFLEFQVLPFCNPHPAPNSIIVLDNASIHRSARVRQPCERAGVRLKYLPPYSPNYNPIKERFKVLKSWLERHAGDEEIFDDFRGFLEYAGQCICHEIDAKSWFNKYGYPA